MNTFFRGDIRTPFGYAAAVALTGLAWLVSQQTPVAAFPYIPLLIFTVAVAASGAMGGQGPAVVCSALSLAALDYFFLPPTGTWKLPLVPADLIGLGAFAAAAAVTAAMARRARRATTAAMEIDAVKSRLDVEHRHREALLELGARALAGGSIEAICRDATTTTVSALGVDQCAVFELVRDGGPLSIACAAGADSSTVEGLSIAADVDTQAGYALYAREPIVVHDADTDARFSLPAPLRARGVRSGIAARIAGVKRTFGVLAAYATSPRTYTTEDAQFVAGVAAVLAGTAV